MRKLIVVLAIGGIAVFMFGHAMLVGMIPQPVHVTALEGTALGAFRDLPNFDVGIATMFFGLLMSFTGIIFSKMTSGDHQSGTFPPITPAGPRLCG